MPVYTVSFGGRHVEIAYDSSEVLEALEFMFVDIGNAATPHCEAQFQLYQNVEQYVVSSDQNETPHQFELLPDAANFLMGEAVYHLIYNNTNCMAIHAGVVSDQDGAILMPGESGSGKSSVTLWMTANGYHYHTDELALIDAKTRALEVFTRPFNIKHYGIAPIRDLIDLEQVSDHIMRGQHVTMFSHRLLNPDFLSQAPALTRMVFPRYQEGDESNQLVLLSRAEAGIELMRTNVIARNLPGHGFKQLLSLVKGIPAYRLSYSHFDQLPALLAQCQ